jgi:putative methylase
MLKKRQLEIALQRLSPPRDRSPRLEQYPTPAHIAADILWEAFGSGDIQGRSVADLGCGHGIFSIGAKLLGAKRVVGVDVDEGAVETARENARDLSLEVEFVVSDISAFEGAFDTTVQNPPFGAQTRHADRAFIEKSIKIAPTVYSLHNEAGMDFVQQMADALGASCVAVKRYKFEIPYAFEFHRKTREVVPVVLLKLQR